MKKFISLFLILFQLFLICFTAHSDEFYEDEQINWAFSDQTIQATAKSPQVEAGAAIAIDSVTGRILFEKNAYVRMPMASTTKIMTAIIALEKGRLKDIVTISKRSSMIGGSTIGLKKDQKFTLKELLYGLMLNSGNDAAIAIAEYIGGTVENFVVMMNEKAEEIGAKDTHFTSPHGLDADSHFSTAFDMAIITRYAMGNPDFAALVSTKSAAIPGKSLYNTNEMLDIYPGADGVKTGYTGKAGRCLVTSATKDNWRIISVVLNCDSRNKRALSSKNILDYAFNNYKLYSLINNQETIKKIEVFKGIPSSISVRSINDALFPLRQDELDNLKTVVELPEKVKAPINTGDIVGKVSVYLYGEMIAQSEIEVCEGSLKKGMSYYIKEIIDSWSKIIKYSH